MSPKSDDSVMFAIRELQKLEADRVEEERRRIEAAVAARKAADEERSKLEREAADHAKQVAEAEARMRVESERRTRDEELALRMSSLRKELDAVQADRLRLQERIVGPIVPERRAGASKGWAVAFAVASAVAAGLAALLVMKAPAPAPVEAQESRTVALVETATEVVAPSAPVAQPEVASNVEARPAVGPESASEARPGSRVRSRADRRRTERASPTQEAGARTPRETRDQRLIELERCGDDPTCGM